MGYYNKFDYEIYEGILLICQNTTMQVYGFKDIADDTSGYMEHGLKHCVLCSKTYTASNNVLKPTASSRQAAWSARIYETRLLKNMHFILAFHWLYNGALVEINKATRFEAS